MSTQLKHFLLQKGISSSRTTPYNPGGNGQVEWYLHMIDEFSRFSSACIVYNKFIEMFIKHWISVYGALVEVMDR